MKSHYDNLESDIIKSGDTGRLYRYAGRKLRSRENIPAVYNSNGNLTTESKDKADIFNEYFSSVFTPDDGREPHLPPKVPSESSIDSVSFTFDNVVKVLKGLPKKTSRTPDGIPALFLRETALENARPLQYLFMVSMAAGKIPSM